MNENHNKNVFINCPFDNHYQSMEDVIIFTVIDCGFKPRSAKESSNSNQLRMVKIQQIIEECSFAIHDISRVEPDSRYKLPRFNMPFELGLFFGAQRYGGETHQIKECLIFDKNTHRYEKFISDIKGNEVYGHANNPRKLVTPIRNFLAEAAKDQKILLGPELYKRYLGFIQWSNRYYKNNKIKREDLSFGKFSHIISEFLLESNED